MKALIDGDIIRYRCGYATQKTKYYVFAHGDEEYGPARIFKYKKDALAWANNNDEYYITPMIQCEPEENAIYNTKRQIETILWSTKSNEYEIFLSQDGDNTFRHRLATLQPYKGKRPPGRPIHYQAITDYLEEKWNATFVGEGLEADDALGIEQTNNQDTIICTIDKDLDMIPGWHYNFVKKGEPYYIDEEQAEKNFLKQLLTGDYIDNIPGLFKITGKKLPRYIWKDWNMLPVPAAWDFVLEGWRGEYDALKEIGKLLWIKRTNEKDENFPLPKGKLSF